MDESYYIYKNIRNLTWDILINKSSGELPLNIEEIAKQSGIARIESYEKGHELLSFCGLWEIAEAQRAISVYTDCWHIFYNNRIAGEGNSRIFPIAHELGHILLGHNMDKIKVGFFSAFYTKWNKEDVTHDGVECEANIFASRLLAPACVLNGINCLESDDIMNLCGLDSISAKERSERLKKLIVKNNFFKNGQEAKVFDKFSSFIKMYKD